ncbi:MAG TPA: hypothetical protein PKE30_04590 [Niabella sp.]|nr:hypothetical protein [Niabella sp.]
MLLLILALIGTPVILTKLAKQEAKSLTLIEENAEPLSGTNEEVSVAGLSEYLHCSVDAAAHELTYLKHDHHSHIDVAHNCYIELLSPPPNADCNPAHSDFDTIIVARMYS